MIHKVCMRRECIICGKEFDAATIATKICSPECAEVNKRQWFARYRAERKAKKARGDLTETMRKCHDAGFGYNYGDYKTAIYAGKIEG